MFSLCSEAFCLEIVSSWLTVTLSIYAFGERCKYNRIYNLLMDNWIACISEFHGRTPNWIDFVEIKLPLSVLPLKPKWSQCVESVDTTWLVYLVLSRMYSSVVKCSNSPSPCSVYSGQHKLAICVLSSEWRLLTDDVKKIKVLFFLSTLTRQ